MAELILTETRERIARIELNRPEKKNALTGEMYQGLAEAVRAAEADSAVRAILIHGRPDCFCAGNDLKDFLDQPPHGDNAPVFQFLQAISTAVRPIVAAVGGPAVGIGATMLLHCDFVYAATESRFQFPFVPLGITPEAASSLLLPLNAGYLRAAELLLLGKPFNAQQALSAGIITEIVPAESLLSRARATALELAALPPESLRLTKALMKKRLAPQVAEQMAEEGRTFRARLNSAEAKEAMIAFFEKRKPNFG
jgi:enoyl-CoA hydratase/carnithine racemase